MSNKQQPPLPTLKPGDSHMESLIEAAIQGHADTRDAMRWLVRQLVPATQPAEVTDEFLYELWEQKYRSWIGGEQFEQIARAILALRPVQVPMNNMDHFLETSAQEAAQDSLDSYIRYSITAQSKKETP